MTTSKSASSTVAPSTDWRGSATERGSYTSVIRVNLAGKKQSNI